MLWKRTNDIWTDLCRFINNKSSRGTTRNTICVTILEEVFRVVNVEQTKLDSFIQELEQTIFKDTIAQYERNNKEEYIQKSYDEFESHLIDGHPYHPSYKARIGFQYRDNFQYGYEFIPIKLIWIATHKNTPV